MTVRDTEKTQFLSRIDERFAAQEQRNKWLMRTLADATKFSDEADPTNPDAARGRPMGSDTLIRHIRKLNPNLVIAHHPTRPQIIVVSRVLLDGKLKTAATFNAGLLSEFSLCERRITYVPAETPVTIDGEEILSAGQVPQTKKDRLKRALTEIFNNPIKRYDENAAIALLEEAAEGAEEPPYQKRLVEVGRELVRGWRTVLVRLVQQNLVNPAEVEKLFGAANRLTWATKMGKREEACPL